MSIEHLDISLVIIREMQSSDHDGVKALSKEMHETLRKIYRPTESAKSINQSQTPFTRIVAVLDEKIVGMATYERDGDSLYFGSLGVLQEYKKQGIARKLVEFIEMEARRLGLSKINCSTILETGNEVIFHKMGFKTVSTIITQKFISTKNSPIHEINFEKIIT